MSAKCINENDSDVIKREKFFLCIFSHTDSNVVKTILVKTEKMMYDACQASSWQCQSEARIPSPLKSPEFMQVLCSVRIISL